MKKDKNLVENETDKNEEQKSIGLCLGMCFGLSIGMSIGSLFDKITIGMVLGEGLGMLLGALCDNFNHKKQGKEQIIWEYILIREMNFSGR